MIRKLALFPAVSGAWRRAVLALGLTLCAAGGARAETALVAVASNFLPTARVLEVAFEAATDHEITLAPGSTGRIYAQIVRGAPYDVFLSADQARPERLEADGIAVARVAYAIGQLVLVTRDEDAPFALRGRRVALANPEIAPYGQAALEALTHMGFVPDDMTLLMGDSVGQTASIYVSGSAEAAFLAASQLGVLDPEDVIISLAGFHAPIRQDAVLLPRGAANPAARAFFDFLISPDAQLLIGEAGYDRPGA